MPLAYLGPGDQEQQPAETLGPTVGMLIERVQAAQDELGLDKLHAAHPLTWLATMTTALGSLALQVNGRDRNGSEAALVNVLAVGLEWLQRGQLSAP